MTPVGSDYDVGSHPTHAGALLLDQGTHHSSVRSALEIDQPRTVNDICTSVRSGVRQEGIDQPAAWREQRVDAVARLDRDGDRFVAVDEAGARDGRRACS